MAVKLTAFVLDDGVELTEDELESILQTYASNLCSLPRTAKSLGIPLGRLRRWAKDGRLSEALASLKELQNEEILYAYTQKALDPYERNPAYKIFYLKKNVSEYADKPKPAAKVEIVLTDGAFTKKATNEPKSGPSVPVDAPADPAKVP
jgi:hypothetical protein